MTDEELLRYSRQILLPEIDVVGQERIRESAVLVLGAGGLGSPAALYLAAAGVGQLLIADHDVVDLSNLQRQLLHGTADIGRPKVASAADSLARLNPHVRVETIQKRLDAETLPAYLERVDVVVDASDNFRSRFALNKACVAAGKVLVSGAAIRLEGQVSVFAGHRPDQPCYRCLYSDEDGEGQLSCSENGVLAPVVGVIGALQATECLKQLAGIATGLLGRLLIWDALSMEFRTLRLGKDPACPVCASSSPTQSR